MGVGLRKLDAAAVNAVKLTDELRQGKYFYQRFDHQPTATKLDGLTPATGTTADINVVTFRNGLSCLQYVVVTQTLLAALLDTTGKGLDISQDQTDNDGVEYVFGSNNSDSPFAFTVGTHNPFFEIQFRIADVSGSDDLLVGFRKVEAFRAAVDDYDEMAAFNVILGDIKVETILNNAATVTTDTGLDWADDATKKLRVEVVGRQVNFYVDGTRVTGLPAFSFDTGEVIQPFFHFLQATTTPGKVWWRYAEGGLLKTTNATGSPSA